MGTPSQIVQGILTAFNTVDGSNTVVVNGGALTNVPMLLTGAEIEYDAGDPVLLLVLGNTYMILGKVAGVASSQYASASQATAGYFGQLASNTAYSPSAVVNVVSANIQVPTWSNRMTFFGSAEIGFKNTSGLDADVTVYHVMNGNGSGSINDWTSAGDHNQKFDKFQSGVQTVVPGSIITATSQFNSTVAGTLLNSSIVSGTCFFSKI